MYIYLLRNEDRLDNRVYIGQTNNIRQRMYAHKCNAKAKVNRPVYNWINEIGYDNVEVSIEMECSKNEAFELEEQTIKKYDIDKNFQVLNEQHQKDYDPTKSFYNLCKNKEEIWEMYNNTDLPREEIIQKFGISPSMLSRVIKQHGGSNRKTKLYGHYEEIQQSIMNGVPMRQLAREYGVGKTSITNINVGVTAYNPNLNYPLNKNVKDKIVKENQFKKKV